MSFVFVVFFREAILSVLSNKNADCFRRAAPDAQYFDDFWH